jgi:hypothetical protein
MRLPAVEQLEGSYVCPHTLRRPHPEPKIVYLDLNHWIALAKALSGHRDGHRHADVLKACIAAVERGAAVFPISDTIYFEVSKIGSYRQRRDLREVIEKVSRYFVVTARSVVSVHEIEALLNRIVGPNPQPINTMDYLDWGVARPSGWWAVSRCHLRTAKTLPPRSEPPTLTASRRSTASWQRASWN